jgi:heme iron utilization protein
MAEYGNSSINPIRQTSPQAIQLAKTLIRNARFGALAVLEAKTQEPFVSRVATATTTQGAPLLLISNLSTHTQALLASAQCSLLVGEPGKGDPLTHPRVSLQCDAEFLERSSDADKSARSRYLRRNPKAKLYADFGDFYFVKLNLKRAFLNGGFGQAFRLTASELLIDSAIARQFELAEADVLKFLNKDHLILVQSVGAFVGTKSVRRWQLTGVDPEGVDLSGGEVTARAWFLTPAIRPSEIYDRLTELINATSS